MLQNLANKPSYAKEPYMASLAPFVHHNKARINKFLMDLCEVGDFYESLEVFVHPCKIPHMQVFNASCRWTNTLRCPRRISSSQSH